MKLDTKGLLTSKHHQAMAQCYLNATTGYPEDWEDEMIDATDYEKTHEELSGILSASEDWRERGGFEKGSFNGFQYIYWESTQILKGQTRESFLVVDFGEFRGWMKR